jgi:chemotaxis protein MotB
MKPAQQVQYEELDAELLQVEPEPESDLRPRRRRGAGVFVLSILLSGVALGLGGYAWQLLNQKQKLESDVAGLQQVKQAAEQRVAQLVQENGQEQARSSQASSERDQLQTALAAANAELQELQAYRTASNEQLAEFRDLRAKFQRMIDSGALDISFRRGRMIVEMPAAVLFDSGSAELSKDGTATVIQVAKILRQVPRHRFLVGGHTDNVPAVKQYKSNWDLSAARAVRVTETLTSHGVAPKRLVIAGYSEYDPVASNGNDTGRQKNRRIEIILEPYVEEKMVQSLLDKEKKATPPGKATAAAKTTAKK